MNRFSFPGTFTSRRRFPAKNRASAGKVPRLGSPLGAKPLSLMGGFLVLLMAAFTACDTGGSGPQFEFDSKAYSPSPGKKDVPFTEGITLEWDGVSTADETVSYHIYVGETLPEEPNYTDITATSYLIPAADLDYNTTYQWMVTARSSRNKIGETDPLSFTTVPAVLASNNFNNGSYIWFDLTLYKNDSLVDVIAVPKGDTPDRAATMAMDDEDGPDDTAGRHFRDTLKTGQSHRIVLYNLGKSTEYDVIAFYENEDYSSQDSQVLTRGVTTGEVVDLGMVDFIVYEGQKILLPSPWARASNLLPTGIAYVWATSEHGNVMTIISENNFLLGNDLSEEPWNNNISIFFDNNTLSFFKIPSITQGYTGITLKKMNPSAVYEGVPHGIRLILAE